MNRDPLLLVNGTIGDRSLLDRMVAGLRAGSYAIVERRPLASGEEAIDDVMLVSPDRSLPAIESTRWIRAYDPVETAIACLSYERRGTAFIERIWGILRAVIATTPHPHDPTRRGSAHTECPFHDLIVRSSDGDRLLWTPDPDIAAKLRPMILVETRDESVPEAPDHVSQVIGLSGMHCYASQDDGTAMEWLRSLRDLDHLAADPTYGRDAS